MQNLKIRVSSEAESEEVKRLAVKAGYTLDALFGKKWSAEFCYLLLCEDMSAGFANEIMADGDKPLSIGELRLMANPVKEWLNTKTFEYKQAACMFGHSEWIEIPEGAEIVTKGVGKANFWKNQDREFYFNSRGEWSNNYGETLNQYLERNPKVEIVWQREQDEPFLTPECTLNDQYAEIEQVRQDEMKEYLIPSANYKYQKAYPITSWREWIEIPEGAEWAKLWDKGESYECVEFYRGENEFFNNSSKKWMRGADQSTNKIGQPATIIWNRHASNSAATLHGTVKAEPDLNFGAAQASGGAKEKSSTPSSAWDTQVGGYHYKQFKIQPMQFALENKLDAAQQNVIKYIMRHSFKNGKQDLEKAKHYIDLMIEFYYGDNNNG